MSKYLLLWLVLLVYFIGYVIFTFIDLEWMPSDPRPASFKKMRNNPLILHDDFLLESGKNGVLSKSLFLQAASKNSFGGASLIKSVDLKSIKYNVTLSLKFIEKFKFAAKTINNQQKKVNIAKNNKINNFVLFTLINDAYLNMTLNWLCNVHALSNEQNNGHIHSSVLIVIIGNSKKSCEKIHKDWPKVTCLTYTTEPQFNEALNWGRFLYFQIMATRLHLIAALAEVKVPFVVFETDSVWLRNPINTLFQQQNLYQNVDLVLPFNYHNKKGEHFAFDPMIAFPSNATRHLTKELIRVFKQTPEASDQKILNNLCSIQYKGVICRSFNWLEVADGQWFKMSNSERKQSFQTPPYIVNNNYYVGIKNKIARQVINSLWFLSPKNVCNLSTAKRKISKFV